MQYKNPTFNLTSLLANREVVILIVVIVLVIVVSAVLKSKKHGSNNRMFKTISKKGFVGPVMDIYLCRVGRSYDECIDEWIRTNINTDFQAFKNQIVAEWRESYEKKLNRAWFAKEKKTQIYEDSLSTIMDDSYPFFEFVFIRNQTQYSDDGYTRTVYTVTRQEKVIRKSINDILQVSDPVTSEIGFDR